MRHVRDVVKYDPSPGGLKEPPVTVTGLARNDVETTDKNASRYHSDQHSGHGYHYAAVVPSPLVTHDFPSASIRKRSMIPLSRACFVALRNRFTASAFSPRNHRW